MVDLNITSVRIYPFVTSSTGGKTLAMADLTIDNALVLRGFRVIEGKSGGLFVGFPSARGKDGIWRETVFALDKETGSVIRNRIIEAYKTSNVG